ncbi:sensor histidine kinase [Bosea sp. NPDC055353]
MNDYAVDDILARSPIHSLRKRRGVAFGFLVVGIITWLFAAVLLIARARGESEQIVQRAQSQAASLSFRFDQEIAAIRFLLKGLAKSPALLSGDLKAFYDQMKATETPEGTWLLLQDLEKQLINTRFPFGTELPRHTSVPNYKEVLEQVRSRGWRVSGRARGPATGSTIIGLHLRVNDSTGQMSHILTSIVSESRLASILSDQKIPAGWIKGLYDENIKPLEALPAPAGLSARIGRRAGIEPIEGAYSDRNADGQPVVVAYHVSGATNWTTVVEVPLASINQPIKSAAWQIGWLGLTLLVTGILATLLIARRMEKPLHDLEGIVSSSTRQINELSTQLLALQEDERQRIARELHDSTAQHLVAASIGLMNLGNRSKRSEKENNLIEQIEGMVDRSLKELRIFTYLLHPPDLERDGLQATLRDFTEGFACRTGLVAQIRVPEEVDALPSDIQWSILRVAQEALGNVHRHAKASRIFLNIRINASRLVMQVRDDGRGLMGAREADTAKIKLGVGVPGMRARLKQFGGDLRIRTGPDGTTVVATVPLSRMGRASLAAERLADALLPFKTKVPRTAQR